MTPVHTPATTPSHSRYFHNIAIKLKVFNNLAIKLKVFNVIQLYQVHDATQGDKKAGLQDPDVHKVNFTSCSHFVHLNVLLDFAADVL